MELGELGVNETPAIVLVFEGVLAHCTHPILERAALRVRGWTAAVDQWEFDYKVCDMANQLMSRGAMVEVLTWHPAGFAEVVHDRLWTLGVQVRETRASSYGYESQKIATDPTVSVVYDADPAHRMGYGFKARELI